MSESVDAGTDQVTTDGRERRSLTETARTGAVALVLSLLINAAVATVARMAEIGEGLMAIQYLPVLVLTAVGVVGATVVYAALSRLTNRPDRTFVAVAAIVLVISIVPDFTYIPSEPGGSVTAGAVLASMHVLTALVVVWLLVDWERVR